ncbi:MAG TPA: hypothetical protein VGF85_01710 [Opitutaceae bacterium]|jgi:hypothetical protein
MHGLAARLFRAAWRGTVALLPLAALSPRAESQPNSSQPNLAPPSTFLDQPVLTTNYSNDPTLPYWAKDKFDSVRFLDAFADHFVLARDPHGVHAYIFYPPMPPPLESEVPVVAPLESGPPAAPELSAFIGDTFYPFMGVRLAYGELSHSMRASILGYRTSKVALQNEIRAQILALKDSGPAERASKLAALAAAEQPRISDLAKREETIRSDLRQMHVLGVPVEFTDLNEKADWREMAAETGPAKAVDLNGVAAATKGIAFYQEGLSADQRFLLFEKAYAIERKARGLPSTPSDGRTVFFSPSTARIRLPGALPEALEAKLSQFQALKEELSGEISSALKKTQEMASGIRVDALSKLADWQSPRFAQLDSLAEEIRIGLASLNAKEGPRSGPELPEDITKRISAYRQHKVELLRKLRAMLAAPTPAAPGAPPKAPDPSASALAWMHDGKSKTEIQSMELRVSVGEFDRVQSELIGQLNKEENGIRESLAQYARSTNGASDRKSVNDLLREFESARQRQEIRDKFRDYRTAVLMPGLSAGQRRLLFDAAIEQLDLPLPTGEKYE